MDLSESDFLPLAFIHMYFDVDDSSVITDVVNYVNDRKNHSTILNYLGEIGLRFMVGDATPDTFDCVMPQFRYVCDRDYKLEIVRFDSGGVYLRKGAVVYATNLFVTDVSAAMDFVLNELPSIADTEAFVNRSPKTEVGEKYYVWNGSDGIVFARPYLDWMGMKVCNGTSYTANDKYRMYIVGDALAKLFIESKIRTNSDTMVLRNYHKGTPLYRAGTNESNVVNHKYFTTNDYDTVFDAFEEEFGASVGRIHFIQRDYIFDANFPPDLANELQKNWVSNTAVYKSVARFDGGDVTDVGTEMVVDRYATNRYRKMVVVGGGKYALPKNGSSSVEHLFVPAHVLQIRHTLNAALVPKMGLVILATHVFFGARRVLDFEPHRDLGIFAKSKVLIRNDDVLYHVGGSYFLEETTFVANQVPIYVIVRVDDDLIVRHNLIRNSRKLKDLKHYWVYNTILSLFVRK